MNLVTSSAPIDSTCPVFLWNVRPGQFRQTSNEHLAFGSWVQRVAFTVQGAAVIVWPENIKGLRDSQVGCDEVTSRRRPGDAMSGAGEQPRLRVKADRLTGLADDLDGMQEYLDKQVRRMDAIVDRIEAGWQGPAARAYRDLHRGAAEDAVRIRMVMRALEQAVRFSRDGFSE
ncbi:WXG100 family type VII secretion target [Streptomyces sp. W4I9-2]|uniref:WXG100 family type VII secretion target n=1 Tax=Streptomyces sp. W4I9-2 TaxID=3042297 RepID=UPI002785BA55|nr:WXG100 family type VII secretion target [Streptomyces sp. W4I9-2]